MSTPNTPIKLTPSQRDVLDEMKNGKTITIDKYEMHWLGDRSIGIDIKKLLDNELIEKIVSSKSLKSSGNGYKISEYGLIYLSTLPPVKRKEVIEVQVEKRPPTDKQLAYAKDLGISIPVDASLEEVSEMISCKVDEDKIATDRHRTFAKLYGVEYSQYTGKKELFDRIFNAISRPTHENELLCWFIFRVYRGLVKGAINVPIQLPNDPIIIEISNEFVGNDKIIKSIQKYSGRDLIAFGEWTSPSGYHYSGGSKKTFAYQSISKTLNSKLGIEEEIVQRKTVGKSVNKSPGCLVLISVFVCITLALLTIIL